MLCRFVINNQCIYFNNLNCALNWRKSSVASTKRLATTLYRGRLTNWQILFKGKKSLLKAAASSYHSASENEVWFYFWPECEAGRMKKILNHNCSLLRIAYGEGSLICHGLIGLYIPSVVVVSHPSGSRKLLWWRQCGPVMSSWSNGLLAGVLKWRQCGSEVSELTNRKRAPQVMTPDVSPGYGLGESRWLILLRRFWKALYSH